MGRPGLSIEQNFNPCFWLSIRPGKRSARGDPDYSFFLYRLTFNLKSDKMILLIIDNYPGRKAMSDLLQRDTSLEMTADFLRNNILNGTYKPGMQLKQYRHRHATGREPGPNSRGAHSTGRRGIDRKDPIPWNVCAHPQGKRC